MPEVPGSTLVSATTLFFVEDIVGSEMITEVTMDLDIDKPKKASTSKKMQYCLKKSAILGNFLDKNAIRAPQNVEFRTKMMQKPP